MFLLIRFDLIKLVKELFINKEFEKIKISMLYFVSIYKIQNRKKLMIKSIDPLFSSFKKPHYHSRHVITKILLKVAINTITLIFLLLFTFSIVIKVYSKRVKLSHQCLECRAISMYVPLFLTSANYDAD